MSDRQKTISREVKLDGPGLFSGEPATLTISPSGPGSGITFIREQGDHEARIPALVENVMKRPRRTCLRNGTLHVETVEHCMAALAGLRINNAMVRIAGGVSGEVPGIDGSSQPFVQAIAEVGLTEQDAQVRPLVIRRPVQVAAGDRTLSALPGPTDHLEIIYDFEAPPPVGRQIFSFHLSSDIDNFVKQVAPARTFIFEEEAQDLRMRGLGHHLTPKDLLVISAKGPIDNEP